MASKKQIEANRENAKKSTGPKTGGGKAISAGNALKHGLTSRRVWLNDEDEDQFRELQVEVMNELRPQGTLETLLAMRVAAQMWRLARVPGIEAELFERLRRDPLGRDEGLAGAWLKDGAPYEGVLARLTRYESHLERSISRMIKEVRQLQADRLRREAREEAGEAQWRELGPDGHPAGNAGGGFSAGRRARHGERESDGEGKPHGVGRKNRPRKITGRPGWDGAGAPEPEGQQSRGKIGDDSGSQSSGAEGSDCKSSGAKDSDVLGGGPRCKSKRRNEPNRS